MAVRLSIVGLLVLLSAGTASAQSAKWAKSAVVFAAAAQGADVISTIAQPQWSRYEVNPMVPKNSVGLIAMKGSIAVVNGLVSRRVAARHPRLVFVSQMALGSALFYVAYRNVQFNRRMARGGD